MATISQPAVRTYRKKSSPSDPTTVNFSDHETRILDLEAQLLPVGTVLLYDADDWVNNTTLPGWYVCDGTCSTPNLVDTFLKGTSVGAGCTGVTGGANSLTLETCQLPEHSHTMASHDHGVCLASHCHPHTHTTSSSACGDHCHNVWALNTTATMNIASTTDTHYATGGFASIPSDTCGSHTHTGSAAECGVSASGCANTSGTSAGCAGGSSGLACAVDNQPSYYSLIYVRKMN